MWFHVHQGLVENPFICLMMTFGGSGTITFLKLAETKVGFCQIEWDLCQIDRDQAGILSNWFSLAWFNSTEPQLGCCQFDMGLVGALLIPQGPSLVSFYLRWAYRCLCQSGFRRITAVCPTSVTVFLFLFDWFSVGFVDTCRITTVCAASV